MTVYYKILKLTSCENIICTTEDEYSDWINRKSIILVNPVVLVGIKFPAPSGDTYLEKFIMNSWMPFSLHSEIEIPINQIITMSDIDDQLTSRYNEYIMFRDRDFDDDEPSLENMSEDLFFGDNITDGDDDGGNDDEETEEDQDDEYEGPPFGSTGRNKRTLH